MNILTQIDTNQAKSCHIFIYILVYHLPTFIEKYKRIKLNIISCQGIAIHTCKKDIDITILVKGQEDDKHGEDDEDAEED